MTKEELKPIDVSKYTVTESGNVIKSEEKETTKEDFDEEVYEYAKSRNGTEDSRMTDRMLAYRAGAESREKEIKSLGERCLQLQADKGNLTDRVKELESQIEKIKCCYNCANDTLEPLEVISNGVCENCINHSKWELEY